MPILKSEAVVLRRVKYGDTSLVLTIYTREFGKISVIAKGARTPKSKFVGALEPATHLQIVFYNKETRELQMLSDAELLTGYEGILNDLRKSAASIAVVGLLDAVIGGEEPNERLFDLLIRTLAAINDEEGDVAYLWYFELRLLEILGFKLDLRMPEGLSEEEKLSGEAASVLELLEGASLPKLGVPAFTRGTFKKINRFFRRYYSYHVDGMKRAKALDFLENL